MSLLQKLPYAYYSQLLKKDRDWCLRLAKAAKLRNAERFKDDNTTVLMLLTELDNRGYTVKQLRSLITTANGAAVQRVGTAPSLKIALLIGNTNYEHWEELVTPETDCRHLQLILQSIGFVTVTILNFKTSEIKQCIQEIFQMVPAKAYCFVYYAGHGIELCGTKYILGVESPLEEYTTENGVSENYIIKNVISCSPELTVILFDMCRKSPDRLSNQKIYSDIPTTEEYECESNLVVGYSTSPFMPTFEKLYCDSTMSQSQHLNCNSGQITSNLRSGKNMSLYVEYLSKYLKREMHVLQILEMVHKEFSENNFGQLRLQKPQKLDNMYSEYFLTTAARGDADSERSIRSYISNLNAKHFKAFC